MLIKDASKDRMPFLPPILNPSPGARMDQERRYVWGASRDTTSVHVPRGYPRRLDGPAWVVEPRLRLLWADTKAAAESGIAGAAQVLFRFGWSDDGRHWILFGLDENIEADRRMMVEFTTMLRSVAEDPTVEIVGGAAPDRCAASLALDEMRRAYRAMEP